MPRTASAKLLFAANARRLRTSSGWTQEVAAERIGLDLRYLQRLEAGEIDLKLSLLDRFARAFGVRAAELLAPAKLLAPTVGRPKRRAVRGTGGTRT